MKRFILIVVLSLSFTVNAVVIFLKGTGCAGKTSICSELKTQGWYVVDEDTIFFVNAPKQWQLLFPQEMENIKQCIEAENIFHAVVRNQVVFKRNIDQQQREKVLQDIDVIQKQLNQHTEENKQFKKNCMYELRRIIVNEIECYAQDYNVIVDTWFLDSTLINELSQRFSAATILVYCPLEDLVKRTINRNAQAFLKGDCINSMRFFHQALMSFMGNYELNNDPEDAIDTLSKDDLLQACDTVNIFLHNSENSTGSIELFTRGEFSKESFKHYIDGFLSKFGDNNIVYIKPKIKYQKLFRTGKNSSSEIAQQIINFIKQ